MRHHAAKPHARRGQHLGQVGVHVIGLESQPVQSRVQLQVHIHRRPVVGSQPLQMARLVDGQRQPLRGRLRHVRGIKGAFQHQDRFVPAVSAQPVGRLEFQQGHAVGIGKARQRVGQAVAVGVGLHHRPQAGIGLGMAIRTVLLNLAAYPGQVVRHRRGRDACSQ